MLLSCRPDLAAACKELALSAACMLLQLQCSSTYRLQHSTNLPFVCSWEMKWQLTREFVYLALPATLAAITKWDLTRYSNCFFARTVAFNFGLWVCQRPVLMMAQYLLTKPAFMLSLLANIMRSGRGCRFLQGLHLPRRQDCAHIIDGSRALGLCLSPTITCAGVTGACAICFAFNLLPAVCQLRWAGAGIWLVLHASARCAQACRERERIELRPRSQQG